MSFSLSPDRDLNLDRERDHPRPVTVGPLAAVFHLDKHAPSSLAGSLDDYDSFSLFRASPSQALAKDAFVSVGELNRYMGNFAPRNNEMVPYVDRPYQGPPPFPFQ